MVSWRKHNLDIWTCPFNSYGDSLRVQGFLSPDDIAIMEEKTTFSPEFLHKVIQRIVRDLPVVLNLQLKVLQVFSYIHKEDSCLFGRPAPCVGEDTQRNAFEAVKELD